MPDTLDSQDRLDVAGSWRHILATVDAVPEDVTIAVSLVHVESGERRGHPGDRSFRAASTIKVLILIALAGRWTPERWISRTGSSRSRIPASAAAAC